MAGRGKRSGMAECSFYPQERACDPKWLQSSDNKFTPKFPLLWINDLLNIPPVPGTENTYKFGHIVIKEADIFGTVVNFEELRSFYSYHVDDGTGVIMCMLHKESSAWTKEEETADLLKTSEKDCLRDSKEERVFNFLLRNSKCASETAKTFQLGDTVRAIGCLLRYPEGVRIFVAAAMHQIDLTEETIRIEATHKFYKDHNLESFINCSTNFEVPKRSIDAGVDTDSEGSDIVDSGNVESGSIFMKYEYCGGVNAFIECRTDKQAAASTRDGRESTKHFKSVSTSLDSDLTGPLRPQSKSVGTTVEPRSRPLGMATQATSSVSVGTFKHKHCGSVNAFIECTDKQAATSSSSEGKVIVNTVCAAPRARYGTESTKAFKSVSTSIDSDLIGPPRPESRNVGTSVEPRNRSLGTTTRTVSVGTVTDSCKLRTSFCQTSEKMFSEASSCSKFSETKTCENDLSSCRVDEYEKNKPNQKIYTPSSSKGNLSLNHDSSFYPRLNLITRKRGWKQ